MKLETCNESIFWSSLQNPGKQRRSVVNKKRNVEKRVRNEAVQVDVLEHVAVDPTQSKRSLIEAFGIRFSVSHCKPMGFLCI